MINMNKKIALFAIVLVIVGTIGTVCSSIASIPYLINTTSKIEKELNKESVIYSKDMKIDELDINTKSANVIIKKHDKDNVIVTQKGKETNFSYEVVNIENKLAVIENQNKNDYSKVSNITDFTDYILQQLYSYNIHSIVIYVPNDVDINVATETGYLNVEDDILLNKVAFKTLSGNISLPKEVKELSKLDIKSRNYIQLSMSELLGIKDVHINSNSINIYSDQNDIFIDNIESYIPNNIDINQNNNDYGNVDISTSIPVASNLSINAYKSNVYIDLPIEKYKINFNVKSSQQINIDDIMNKNIISENDYLKYNNTNELNGNLNKNLNGLEKEYKVNVKSEYVNID